MLFQFSRLVTLGTKLGLQYTYLQFIFHMSGLSYKVESLALFAKGRIKGLVSQNDLDHT